MQSIIHEFYFSNINPNKKHFDQNSQYAKDMHTICDNEDELTLLLTDKEKQLFLYFVNTHGSMNTITAVENFIIGFRLGVRFGIEVMDDESNMLEDLV